LTLSERLWNHDGKAWEARQAWNRAIAYAKESSGIADGNKVRFRNLEKSKGATISLQSHYISRKTALDKILLDQYP